MNEHERLGEELFHAAYPVIREPRGRFFDELFAEATSVAQEWGERFCDWFDVRSATFGGRDALDTVRAMIGNAARFDFGAVGSAIPKIDLPTLQPRFRNAMTLCAKPGHAHPMRRRSRSTRPHALESLMYRPPINHSEM